MPNVKNSITPSIIHFIWVGGTIPQKYLRTLLKIAPVAKKSQFTLNLWVDDTKNFNKSLDNFMGFDNRNALFLNLAINANTLGITLRNINELLPIMEKSNFYNADNRLQNFKSFLRREAVGFKNLAAVSDLLRYEILRQEGGIYCDTDTDFDIKENSLFQPLKLSYGIKTTFFYDEEDENGNDIIAAIPQHKALEYTLEYLLNDYQKIDQQFFDNTHSLKNYLHSIKAAPTKNLFNKKIGKISVMDLKRNPSNTIIAQGILIRPLRVELTVKFSGPLILKKGLKKFNQEYQSYEFDEQLKAGLSPSEIITAFRRLNANTETIRKNFQLDCSTNVKLGNVKLTSNSDVTWMPKKNEKLISFDDSALSSKSFFWKLQKEVKDSIDQLPPHFKPTNL